jgi:TonB family protein
MPVLALSFIGMSAQAEWRCDCTTIIDMCSATVTVENNAVSIESDHLQCSRVDYLIDGLPFVALVVEGRERQNWLSRSEDPRVLMQSCQVCLDNSAGGAPLTLSAAPPAEPEVASAAAAPGDTEPTPLLAVEPQYPSSAASRRVDGFVDVTFTVTALGLVENASVAAAEPPGMFDQAALAAIARWRYGADEGRAPITLSHRFDFKAANAAVAASAYGRATAETAIDALIAHSGAQDGADAEVAVTEPNGIVRNHCIREQLSYDFGEMVDVNLMNTCGEPLMVYSCAEGVGRFYRRWVCQSGENAKSILVRPGDRLAGNVAMIEVPEGVRTFKYSEDLFVARPRNTQYWWLACGVDDADCRGSGRQWARSMDGKAANIDPQLWTQQNVARSN